MLRLVIAAKSMGDLKAKLQDAADSINVPTVDQSSALDFYESKKPIRAFEESLGQGPTKTHTEIVERLAEAQQVVHAPANVPAETTEVIQEQIAAISHAAPLAAGSTELDNRGVPWHPDLHAESKATTKDGAWRARRNVDKKALADYEAQFVNKVSQAKVETAAPMPVPVAPAAVLPFTRPAEPSLPSPAALVPPPPAPTVEVQQPVFMSAAPVSVATAPVPQQAPVSQPVVAAPPAVAAPSYDPIAVPPAPQVPAHSFETFRKNIIPVVVDLVKTGKIDQPYVEAVKKHFGVTEIWKVTDDQAREMFEQFCHYGFLQKVNA